GARLNSLRCAALKQTPHLIRFRHRRHGALNGISRQRQKQKQKQLSLRVRQLQLQLSLRVLQPQPLS
ncbi:MAG TPA: hypothetical protein VF797_09190, partial [Noviherbaspirillum sp.]